MKALRSLQLQYRFLLYGAVWTAVVALSFGLNLHWLQRTIMSDAYTTAAISSEKDLLFRRWISERGGVYVPVTVQTPANPYLRVPNRDLTATNGLPLTLMNPAYVMRQVNELAQKTAPFLGHLTSLNPLRPENRPDSWEEEALKGFESGTKESSTVNSIAGKEYFRLMRPFMTEASCLKCHAAQGYRLGDIRGGISVSVPMAPLRAAEDTHLRALSLGHALLWIIGIFGIGVDIRHLRDHARQRKTFEEELLALSLTDPLTGLYNRRGFLTFAERQLTLSLRTRQRMILFFADQDGLKRINDTLGHEEGDQAIVETASLLKKTFRASDIVARIGGDEYVVLAVDPDANSPEAILERLQGNIARHNREAKHRYELSLSIGFAVYDPNRPLTLDALMTQADNAMYEEKKRKFPRPA